MEKETMGTVISVIKQWWLKVNRKPARVHAMDGAAFPHIIKVKYTIDGKDYICRKWIGAGNNVPDKVIYALSDFLIMILSWLVKQSLRAFLFQEVQP